MSKLKNGIDKLEEFVKNGCSIDELFLMFKELGSLPYCLVEIHKDRNIYRARYNGETEFFHHPNELSYRKDVENIKNYGRANIPNQSVFYGSIVSGEIDYGVATPVMETSANLRKDIDGVERFTFSKWRVKNDFEAICLLTEESTSVGQFKEMYEGYKEFIRNSHEPVLFNKFYTLLEKELSKRVKANSSSEYMISAAFAAYVFKGSRHPIIYPSIQSQSKGFNIVLHPSYVDDNLQLVAAGVGELHKKGKKSVFNNLYMSEEITSTAIKYAEEKEHRLTDEEIEKQLADQ